MLRDLVEGHGQVGGFGRHVGLEAVGGHGALVVAHDHAHLGAVGQVGLGGIHTLGETEVMDHPHTPLETRLPPDSSGEKGL